MLWFLVPVAFALGFALAAAIVQARLRLRHLTETAELQNQLNELKVRHEVATQNLDEQKKSHTQQLNQLEVQFENLAQKIFEEKSTRFAEQNQKNLHSVLEPIKERLKEFQQRIETTYSQEQNERGFLRGEINKLIELNKTMSNEAHNLTRALKGENKTQGNWGELILENILERSGLRKNEEYTIQGTGLGLTNSEGKNIQPDVIVNLPDSKHIIVDSKMTLNAYEQYSAAESIEEQEQFGKLHVEALKRHIDGLSEKKYHTADKLISPDFVILFMPLEPAFALAFKLKPDLFQYAWDKNIAIVSPTTLLATLRTVAALWKQDRSEKNALEISKRGGLLYDKFAGLLEDLNDLGKKLGAAQDAHHKVIKKMSEGRGNLIDQVEDLKTLGAKTGKALPALEQQEKI